MKNSLFALFLLTLQMPFLSTAQVIPNCQENANRLYQQRAVFMHKKLLSNLDVQQGITAKEGYILTMNGSQICIEYTFAPNTEKVCHLTLNQPCN
jgi:hypothetical protein